MLELSKDAGTTEARRIDARGNTVGDAGAPAASGAADVRALLLRFRPEEPDADSLLSGELQMDVAALTRLHVHDRLETNLVAIEGQRLVVVANQHHLSPNRSQHACTPLLSARTTLN